MDAENNSLVNSEGEDQNPTGLSTISTGVIKDTFSSYDHGFTNGAYSIEREPFEKYLAYYHSIQETERLINHNKLLLRDYRNNKEVSRIRIAGMHEKRIVIVSDLAKQQSLYTDADSWLKNTRENLQHLKRNLQQYLEDHPTDYKFFPAVMFFIFAIIFMGADFGIATLVADTLGIVGTWEKWLFAGGLAGLSVMLKPVYDRLLEKHYVKNKRLNYYNWFVMIIAALVLILLVNLGVFRMSTMAALNASSPITTDATSNVNDAVSSADPTQTIFGQISFVLSSVLFSLASAICLGISLPIFHKEWKIKREGQRKDILEKEAKVLEETVANLTKDLKLASVQYEQISDDIKNANEEKEGGERYDGIMSVLEGLYIKLFHEKSELSKALFNDGYLRGGKIAELNGNIDWILEREIKRQQQVQDRADIVELENLTVKQDAVQQGELTRTRPYLAIRKMIAKDMRDKFNNGNEPIEVYG